ncbi:ATPase domain-containing protein [Archaeoglobus veneficus]|uniref:Putative circadian clock protein, KaiC n=1 Tax=Archaeoglobus veneficus (strain DSM 11195 / SNP6) TaxID=693661 RepID=F2KRN2_ARCVS|nr:ATPase domain-containing protein [Archaeoglobus veneficus]AEA46797.1 putative circadian clock protein, KaiC [Archaeoglobus veneficus SNP6]
MPKRVSTGIPGFDELCGGGLPQGGTYLVVGAAESGKTVFSMQYLVNGARMFGEAGIFITTEESPRHIRDRFSSWQIEDLEDENMLAVIDARLSLDMGEVAAIKDEIGAERAVLDSANPVCFPHPWALLNVSGIMKALDLTSIFTCQTEDMTAKLAADGLIVLHYLKGGYFESRGIEIVKMRSSPHSEGVHPFEITEMGIVVHRIRVFWF